MANKYGIYGAAYEGDGTTSSEASGSTVTITIASPGVVSWTGHPFSNDDAVYFSTTGALPTGLTANTKYYVRNKATNSFEVSATAGGASINTSGTQSGTHTANGAGAWKIDQAAGSIFHGTAPTRGALSAGDVVYMRSKTGAGANANITVSLASTNISIGSASATSAAPITWIIDNGAVWTGVDGVLKYTRSGTAVITHRAYNIIEAKTSKAFVFEEGNSSANAISAYVMLDGTILINPWFDFDNVTYSLAGVNNVINLSNGNAPSQLINPTIDAPNKVYSAVIMFSDYIGGVVVNPTITLSTTLGAYPVFGIGNYGSRGEVYGGVIKGAGATTGQRLVSMSFGQLTMCGLQYPNTMTVRAVDTTLSRPSLCSIIGADKGMGAVRDDRWGSADSRADNNPPVLNAVYPNSGNTGWAWRVYPANVFATMPMDLPILKLYTEDADDKVVTLELLVANTFSAVNKGSVWIDLIYIDNSTNEPAFVTSCDFQATASLDSSSAGWSATTWGSITFTKHKIILTTPSAIKKDTMMVALLRGKARSASANDILFVCPDLQLSAVA